MCQQAVLTGLLIVSCVKYELRSKVLRRPAHSEGLGVHHRLALNIIRSEGNLLCETEIDDPREALSIDHNIFRLRQWDLYIASDPQTFVSKLEREGYHGERANI